MRIEQIKYIKAVYDTGSISAAAKKLFLSQPNISTSIKSLENELGFEILNRTINGVTFTPKGLMFIREAKDIVDKLETISALKDLEETTCYLRVISDDFTPVDDAFLATTSSFCSQNIKATLTHATQYSTLEYIEKGKADIGIIISANIDSINMKNTLEESHLKWIPLSSSCFNINVSENHPAIIDNKLDVSKLKNYPFVTYNLPGKKETGYANLPQFGFVNTQRIISVTSKELKCQIVSNSTAYSVGVTLAPKRLKTLHWRSFPIERFKVYMGLIVRKKHQFTEVETMFIEELKKALTYLDTADLSKSGRNATK